MKITIPKPCHENWNTMTPDEKGRFCAVCSKTVRDFRKTSDDDIIDVFSKTSEEICGNFNPSQLNRELHYSYINTLFVKFAVGAILTTGGIVSVKAQQNKTCDTLKTEEVQKVVFNTQRDRKLLGSVSVVPASALLDSKEKEKKEIVSKLSGVIGKAPEDHNNIRIGGAPSSGAVYKPMYVVNGRISDYEKVKALDPNLIKTMNILKGASASAKYGEKAKDGVVVITTKKKIN
ncbi:TonB-dependent receptor plug domain-containing protein [Chryseobacterium sp.]|jgi:TonB-dependent SusC/RagA subfamily outer membrane receptor|uniref:TonB-dependent receptor plug domain-containing protein n=1 Tax=Chryseobacterium sp. TaxID=1871047 RepID=UPI00283CD6FF|nr:TonB-dependent receptor plug domain-containing protein [Chryseobacterium sp.]MDR3023158.1 TonB-dependent receptor plug domain-containing protein [Chryseobacterium sp.]